MSNKSYLSVYAKSFSWAGYFLPKETFKKCSALYDFCRVADNIADDDDKIENKEKKFIQFENDFNQKNFDNMIIKNMWGLIEEFNISLKIVQDLLIGIKSDIKDKVKLNSKKDLLIYSYRVAGTVGLMMAKIMKVNKKYNICLLTRVEFIWITVQKKHEPLFLPQTFSFPNQPNLQR